MAMLEDRLSTTFVDGVWIAPESRFRPTLLEDYEGGPIAPQDTSQGLNYQIWALSYALNGDIILTPETTGLPVTVLPTVLGCEQISFCFDQNGRPSVAYIIGGSCFLYWYDSVLANFTTDEFTGIFSAMLSMDDKRAAESAVNDILWWYTKLTGPGQYSLYHRRQRDRFQTEFLMKTGCLAYMSRAGMHDGLRGKIATRAGI